MISEVFAVDLARYQDGIQIHTYDDEGRFLDALPQTFSTDAEAEVAARSMFGHGVIVDYVDGDC